MDVEEEVVVKDEDEVVTKELLCEVDESTELEVEVCKIDEEDELCKTEEDDVDCNVEDEDVKVVVVFC